MEVDQESLLSIASYAQNILGITDPQELREICIDGVRRLLEDKKVFALVEHIGEKTEVWDFSSDAVLSILEQNWELFKPPQVRRGDHDFILSDRKYFSVLEKSHPNPVIFLKEPPDSIV